MWGGPDPPPTAPRPPRIGFGPAPPGAPRGTSALLHRRKRKELCEGRFRRRHRRFGDFRPLFGNLRLSSTIPSLASEISASSSAILVVASEIFALPSGFFGFFRLLYRSIAKKGSAGMWGGSVGHYGVLRVSMGRYGVARGLYAFPLEYCGSLLGLYGPLTTSIELYEVLWGAVGLCVLL